MSAVTKTAFMFWNARLFNAPIGDWDVGVVQNFESMFRSAHSFNQPLLSWDVSSAQIMGYMFEDAIAFNQPLQNWDVSGATSLQNMFGNASAFNQNICSFGSKVDISANIDAMFEGSACPETSSPDLFAVPSGPWCAFCGSPAPASGPSMAPTTAQPTLTFQPTGPTEKPTSVEPGVGVNPSTGAVAGRLFAAVLLGIVTGSLLVA